MSHTYSPSPERERSHRERGPPPPIVTVSDRIPGAPLVSCSLSDFPQSVSLSERQTNYDKICFDITFKYEYPQPGLDAERRSITIFRPALFAHSTWALLHHSPTGFEMISQDGFEEISPAMDGPRLLPLTINESDFVSLSPGESWTDRIPLDDDELAESFQVGEKYSYQFIGTFVQWWDWGTLKDHEHTSIREDETSHDVRPKIIIPASNSFEFVVIA